MRNIIIVFFISFLPLSCLSFEPLGETILGFPGVSSHYLSDRLTLETEHSTLLNNSNSSLRQSSRIFSFQKSLIHSDYSLGFAASSRNDEITYNFDENRLRISDDHDAWGLTASAYNWQVKLGNRVQSIGYTSNLKVVLMRQKLNKDFSLNLQNELNDPLENQFIFNHNWNDYRWGLQISNGPYTLLFNAREKQTNDRGLTLKYKYQHLEHSLLYHNTDIDYERINLSDIHYSYGRMQWTSKGKLWLWQSTLETEKERFWQFSVVSQNLSFRTNGQVSLFDIIGQSSNLAGANWFWGVQGEFKSVGININRGWVTGNMTHSWGVSLNKLSPMINSKTYKSVILIGVPNLENEKDLDINYSYLSMVSWASKYAWDDISLKLSIDQIIPIYTNKITKNKSLPDSNKEGTGSNNNYKHVGYNINLLLSWRF